jgi:DNA-binding NtrC family response regulator
MDPLPLLIVSTDPAGTQRLSTAVGAVGHLPVPAETAEEAAAALAVPGVGAVLVDLSLPGLDRAALARALTPATPVPPDTLAAAERRHIAVALQHTRGNRRQAALLLGISRSTLLHKIRRYELEAVAVRTRSSR